MARRFTIGFPLPRARGPVAVVLLVLLVAGVLLSRRAAPGLPAEGTVAVAVDGDTLRVRAGGRTWRVRLIGIDTPEAHPCDKLDRDARRTRQDKQTILRLGRQAGDFTRALCEGKHCRLEYDPANAASGHRDRYGRLLAFVWVTGEDGADVLANTEIVRAGYAAALTRYPFHEGRKAELMRLEREARAEGRGLWREWRH